MSFSDIQPGISIGYFTPFSTLIGEIIRYDNNRYFDSNDGHKETEILHDFQRLANELNPYGQSAFRRKETLNLLRKLVF